MPHGSVAMKIRYRLHMPHLIARHGFRWLDGSHRRFRVTFGLQLALVALALMLLSSCGGGGGGDQPSATANGGRAAGSMSTARNLHSATLLADGRVLVSGGYDNSGNASDSAEIYDPQTNSWAVTTSMSTGRRSHKSLLLPDGDVLVLGGYDRNNVITTSVERYNPTTRTWSNVEVSSFSGDIIDATPLASGEVLVTGGVGTDPIYTSAAIYQPANEAWTAVASIPEDWNPSNLHVNGNRHGVAYRSLRLQDGRVLVLGGEADLEINSAAVTLFNPLTRSWETKASAFQNGTAFTATLLPQGLVLVTGGKYADIPTQYARQTRWYDPVLDVWTPTGDLATARSGHTATLMPDGSVMVIGGVPESASRSIERLVPGSSTWVSVGLLINGRVGHTATLLPNGSVLVVGGGQAAAELWR